MKIAIMTQPLGHNYGGIMQAFALQKVLRTLGHDVVTIDYIDNNPGFLYKQIRFGYRLLMKLRGRRKVPIDFEKHFEYFMAGNHKFIRDNIFQTETLSTETELKLNFYRNRYELVIVGSDQVWRPKYSLNIYNYYLDFLENCDKVKRISYAASFGVSEWEYNKKDTAKCAELAKKFDAISVREQSGVDLCSKYLGVDSVCLLDPTLLLDKEEYLALLGDKCKGESEGVFTYFLDKTEEKINLAKVIASRLNTETFSCQSRLGLGDLISSDMEDYKIPAVEDWLSSFASASYIVTDSFHGCLFSIINKKPFLVIANLQRGVSRFESILGKLGLLDQIIYDFDSVDLDFKIKNKINWFHVDDIIMQERSRAYKFFKDNIN
ncbi:polysaccharide pyruvyl transferase family protein [Denitrificimonas caeni]|uniref:polysaccharide pyruvyl transferase family protein n=1 Tax=Denitrificimonas caeni TaxID=521720 RepID=UPI00196567EB|nr:polysaccharide pyruvyl transferase family protein [Denitrificimonas caeni]